MSHEVLPYKKDSHGRGLAKCSTSFSRQGSSSLLLHFFFTSQLLGFQTSLLIHSYASWLSYFFASSSVSHIPYQASYSPYPCHKDGCCSGAGRGCFHREVAQLFLLHQNRPSSCGVCSPGIRCLRYSTSEQSSFTGKQLLTYVLGASCIEMRLICTLQHLKELLAGIILMLLSVCAYPTRL